MSEFKGTLSSEELIRIVKMAGESDNIDAKGPVEWDGGVESAKLAKDIAAFANSRNGGVLVIGKIEKDTGEFEFTGITTEQATTFDTTDVAKWVNNRFSPPIKLVCYQQEVDSRLFVVIEVLEFEDVPIMCVKSFPDPANSKNFLLRERTIYVRNANAESAPVGNVEELRTLIGLATKKRSDELLAHFDAMLKGRPLIQSQTDEEQFQKEIDEIEAALKTRKKSEKHCEWYFSFHPAKYSQNRWPERDFLEALVQKYSFRIVEQFPPCYKGTQGREWGIANDFYGEPWAFTRSGLFFSRRPFREDEMRPIQASLCISTYDTNQLLLKAGEWIDFGISLRAICEFFLFISRISSAYGTGETIEYQLIAKPLAGRRLVMHQDCSNLYEIPNLYGPADPCLANIFCRKATLSVEELQADWKSECVNAMKDFLELFPSHGINRERLQLWIEGFLKRDSGIQWQRVK